MGSHELSDRARRLLAALVRGYIETGEAVSSQVLAVESGLGVSSATVRNMLAQLEEAGLRPPAAHLGRPRARPTSATACSWTACSRHASPSRPPANVENQHPAAGRTVAADGRSAGQRVARRVPRRPSRRLRHGRQRRRGPAADRVRAARATPACWWWWCRSNGQVTQKVVDLGEHLSSDDLVARRQLPEHRVCRPAAARRPRGGAGAAAAGADAVRRSCWPASLRLAQASLDDVAEQQAFHVEGAASLLERRRATASRRPRCARCSR